MGSKKTGEWRFKQEAHFWHHRLPFQVKYEIEKLTGTLLERDRADSEKLLYKGSSTVGIAKYDLQLRFEAVLPKTPYVVRPPTERSDYRNLFLLHVETRAPKKWASREEVEADGRRAFEHWTLHLACGSETVDWADHSRLFYEQQVQESIQMEQQQATRVEDPAPMIELQNQVLDALRKGKQFRTAHKEGGSVLFFNGKNFAREDYGEDQDRKEFASDQEMIAAIRAFFDWESRRDTYPHRPPELEVWRYIQRQLR